MHFLTIVTPASDLHIDIDKFANTTSGKVIQAAINLGWGIIVKNDSPLEKAIAEYVQEHGGDVFLNAPEGTIDAAWTHIISSDCLV